MQLSLYTPSSGQEAPLTGLPSETVFVKIHANVRLCGTQFARVIYTLAVSAADDCTFIRIQFIVTEREIVCIRLDQI